MTDERDDPTWLLEPPGSNQVHFHIETGEDVELSPGARQAIEDLVRELSGGEDEVEGFMFGIWDCDEYGNPCGPDNCTLNNCQPLTTTPLCFAHSHCKIIMS